MNPKALIEFADGLAEQLRQAAAHHNMSPAEMLTSLTMAERLLTQVYPGCQHEARSAILEGHAIFDALRKPPQQNELN